MIDALWIFLSAGWWAFCAICSTDIRSGLTGSERTTNEAFTAVSAFMALVGLCLVAHLVAA